MSPMKAENLCSDCRMSTPSNEHKRRLIPLGSTDRNQGAVGKRGHWLEETQEYKCSNCGARWENLVESGAGGHGNFWTRIDPPK